MSKKAETSFSDRVKRDLDQMPHSHFFKLMAGSIRGLPDRVGCKRGRFIALELKVGRNKADALQGWVLRKLSQAGAYTAVVTPENWDIIKEEINNL